MMHKARFEHRDESMNPAWEEGIAREAYLEGRTHMLSLEGGGASLTEKMAEEQVGKGTADRRNCTKDCGKSRTPHRVQGNCEQIPREYVSRE